MWTSQASTSVRVGVARRPAQRSALPRVGIWLLSARVLVTCEAIARPGIVVGKIDGWLLLDVGPDAHKLQRTAINLCGMA